MKKFVIKNRITGEMETAYSRSKKNLRWMYDPEKFIIEETE